LAEAHVLALRYLFEDGESRCLNLGTGQGYSVREVIDAVASCRGATITTRDCPRRAGDPAELVADARQAQELLKWSPRWSSLDQIVETAYRWYERPADEFTAADPQSGENSAAISSGQAR
jgi:UDP-glucose 4-epimerase